MKQALGRWSAIVGLGVLLVAATTSQAATAIAAGAGAPRAGAGSANHQRTVRVNQLSQASSIRTLAPSPAAAAVQTAAPTLTAGPLRANFDGVGSLDSAITNFGAEFEPPDQGLCAGNGFVVEMVNSAFRVYDTHGHTLAGPTNVNAPFHEGFAEFTSDPRCYFDRSTNTWFATILFINSTSTASTIDIAYNTSGDPTTDWSIFRIDTTRLDAPAGHGCPCFGDQPTLGIDASNLYVSTNDFSILGPEFNGAQIYAIAKRDLVHHANTVHFVHYADLMIDGNLAASVQPALTYGSAPAEYFLSSLDAAGAGDSRIAVWSLTNVNRVASGGTPRLSSVIIGSEPYAIPPGAEQLGAASLLDAGDDRMQQTQFINGEIWGALDTAVTPAGDSAPRAGAAWFRVRPQLHGSVVGGAKLTGQGYVVSRGNYVLYPAIQADSQGHAAMVVTLSGANRYASAAYAVLADGGRFSRPVVAAAGSGPYDSNATRWGDYSWAFLDPATDTVWMATEYMPPAASQTLDGLRNWGTRVLQLSLD
ncbi:MAG: hypothetical protein ACHQ0J_04140 [Candidatus Dormibacterales bacterium]